MDVEDDSRCRAWLNTALTGRRRRLLAPDVAITAEFSLLESISGRSLPNSRLSSTEDVVCNLHCSVPLGGLEVKWGLVTEAGKHCEEAITGVSSWDGVNFSGAVGDGGGLDKAAAWNALPSTDSISST